MKTRTAINDLREDLEKLVLIEEVAERRQEVVEKRISEVLDAGITPEQLRSQLGLSTESLDRLVNEDPPSVPERLGVSEQTAENLGALSSSRSHVSKLGERAPASSSP